MTKVPHLNKDLFKDPETYLVRGVFRLEHDDEYSDWKVTRWNFGGVWTPVFRDREFGTALEYLLNTDDNNLAEKR